MVLSNAISRFKVWKELPAIYFLTIFVAIYQSLSYSEALGTFWWVIKQIDLYLCTYKYFITNTKKRKVINLSEHLSKYIIKCLLH